MSRTTYYYEPINSLNIIEEPGEVCDYCGDLGSISKANTLIPMPFTEMDAEYGSSAGNVHAHVSCALKAFEEWKQNLASLREELVKRGLVKETST